MASQYGKGIFIKFILFDFHLLTGISFKNFRKFRSSTPTQKGFWIVIFMGGLAGAVYFISQTIDVYLSYPTTTTTRLHLVDQHDFPSNRGKIINYH